MLSRELSASSAELSWNTPFPFALRNYETRIVCVRKLTWEQPFHLQCDGVSVGAALILHHQVVGTCVLDVGLIDVKCCEITVFALILCNIINSESACGEKRKIMLRVIAVIGFISPS